MVINKSFLEEVTGATFASTAVMPPHGSTAPDAVHCMLWGGKQGASIINALSGDCGLVVVLEESLGNFELKDEIAGSVFLWCMIPKESEEVVSAMLCWCRHAVPRSEATGRHDPPSPSGLPPSLKLLRDTMARHIQLRQLGFEGRVKKRSA